MPPPLYLTSSCRAGRCLALASFVAVLPAASWLAPRRPPEPPRLLHPWSDPNAERGLAQGQKDAFALVLGSRVGPTGPQWERELERKPDDVALRARLLGYYQLAGRDADRQRHVFWLIRHRPSARVLGIGFADLPHWWNQGTFAKARALWQTQVQRHPEDPRVLQNAAEFLRLADREKARSLLERAQRAAPRDAGVVWRLGYWHDLEMRRRGADRQAEARRALELYERWHQMSGGRVALDMTYAGLATTAFEAGERERAREWAARLVEWAGRQRPEPDGDGLLTGHRLLGRVALHAGDRKLARFHLLEAVRTPPDGSLLTGDPGHAFVTEMVNAGERAAVIEYLRLGKRFWDEEQLDAWIAGVRAGRTPDWGMQSD